MPKGIPYIAIRQSGFSCVGKYKPFSMRASLYLYWDLLHWIVGLNFCTKHALNIITQAHYQNVQLTL